MKILLMKTLFLLFILPCFSQDVNVLLREAKRLEEIPNELAALNKLKEVLQLQPANIYALSKSSELCSRIGTRETNTNSREAWFKAALAYATIAIKHAPLNDQANVSIAMILGKSTMARSGKEKIKDAKLIRKHVEIALKTNPNNYLAWHILGRWSYEISSVNAVERAAAKIFYGGLPQASLKDAIMYFEKAKTLMPFFILNYIELAKAYHRDGQTEKAIKLLRTIQTFPLSTEDDSKHKAEALKMIKDWE